MIVEKILALEILRSIGLKSAVFNWLFLVCISGFYCKLLAIKRKDFELNVCFGISLRFSRIWRSCAISVARFEDRARRAFPPDGFGKLWR